VTHALDADEEDEWFAARSAGVESCEPDGLLRLHAFGVRPDRRLVEKRQRTQIFEAGDGPRIEVEAREEITVVRHVGSRMLQERAEPGDTQLIEAPRRPPLAAFHGAEQCRARVLLQAFLQGKQDA
jgi:hypothetical protein